MNCIIPGSIAVRIKMLIFFICATIISWLIIISIPEIKRKKYFKEILLLPKKLSFILSIIIAILIALIIPIDKNYGREYSSQKTIRQTSKAPEEKIPQQIAYKGNISEPRPFARVSRAIMVTGYTENLPSNFSVWLSVDYGKLSWPKEPVINPNSHFSVIVHEGGYPPKNRFNLVLYAVGPKGNQEIEQWLDNGRNTGNFPGISAISESTKLQSIELELN
jgi:hypothetical protein